MEQYSYIDGNLFKKLIICGATNLDKHREVVNNLNVFPIPDGDTGDNMSMTIGHGVSEVNDLNEPNIGLMSKKVSRGMLFGARGNSGVILSQIFRGIADGLKDDIFNELQQFHWFLGICKSASKKSLHIWRFFIYLNFTWIS